MDGVGMRVTEGHFCLFFSLFMKIQSVQVLKWFKCSQGFKKKKAHSKELK